MDGIHECEQLKEANIYYQATIYDIEGKWYYRIEEDGKEEEQEVLYCPFCGEMLE